MVRPSSLDQLIAEALPGRRVLRSAPIGLGLGVFSVVHRVELDTGAEPASVVVKRPHPGSNGAAAAAAGAYRRESLSYRTLLPTTPVGAPRCHLVSDDGDRASFVLEDLGHLRAVDQLEGLAADDAGAVAVELAHLHRHWQHDPTLARLPVRRAAPQALDPAALAHGRTVVAERWAEVAGHDVLATIDRLLARRQPLVEAFSAAAPVTLCHGDARADNTVFAASGSAVLYDWQQVAVQFAEADLAWLMATSLEPAVRRVVERQLVADHAGATGADVPGAWRRYRLGLVLPGLAVLLLAQRELSSPRAQALLVTSLRRIMTAVADLDVAALGA